MTTAASHPQDFAQLWRLLHAWRDLATRSAGNAPAILTRKQAAPLMRWIYVIEFVLRRLVLIAATALIVSLPTKRARAATGTAIACRATTTRPAANTANMLRLCPHTRRPCAAAAPRTAAIETKSQPPACPRRRPSAPIDPLLRADRQHLHDAGPLPQRDDSWTPPPPAPKRASTLYAAQSFAERIAHLAQLVASPDKLIARAARALARRRELALHLAEQYPPRRKGILRTLRHVIPEILAPLHDACADILLRYAHANTS